MSNENMTALLEARLTMAAESEGRLTALAAQLAEELITFRNHISAAQLVVMRIHETPPHRRISDTPRGATLTFDKAEKVPPSNWPPRDPMEQLP